MGTKVINFYDINDFSLMKLVITPTFSLNLL